MELNSGPGDVERIKILYEEKGGERAPFWAPDNWGPPIPDIEFREGQFRQICRYPSPARARNRDRGHGPRVCPVSTWLRMGAQSPPVRRNGNSRAQSRWGRLDPAFSSASDGRKIQASTLPSATPRERTSAIARSTSSCFTRSCPPSPIATSTRSCCGKPGGSLDLPVSSSCSTLPTGIRSAEPTFPAKK